MTDGWTEINTTWENEMQFVGTNQAGATVRMGSSDTEPGVGPMQLLLIALAGCTGMDIVSILQKKRIDLKDMQIKVRGKRAADYPMIWTDINILYSLWGENILPKDAEQAIRLSEEKYCSVGLMLGKVSKITSDYRLYKPGEIAK
jgi:putative redox protein